MFNRKYFILDIQRELISNLQKIGYCIIFLSDNNIYVFIVDNEYSCKYYPINYPLEVKEKMLKDLTWSESKQLVNNLKFSNKNDLDIKISKYLKSPTFKIRQFFNQF